MRGVQVKFLPVFYATFDVFTFDLFQFKFDLKYKKIHLKFILYRHFNSSNFQNWAAVEVVLVHAALPMPVQWQGLPRKASITNEM